MKSPRLALLALVLLGAPQFQLSAEERLLWRFSPEKTGTWLYHGNKQQSGEGNFSPGWSAGHWDGGSQVQLKVDDEGILTVDTLGPKPGGQAYYWRNIEVDGGRNLLLSFEYRTDPGGEGALEFRLDGVGRDKLQIQKVTGAAVSGEAHGSHTGKLLGLKPSGGWQEVELRFMIADGPAKLKPYFKDAGTVEGGVHFRNVRVVDTGAVVGYVPPPFPATAESELDDYGRWLKRQLESEYALDAPQFLFGRNQRELLGGFWLETNHGAKPLNLSTELVAVEGMPFDTALRWKVHQTGRIDWSYLLKNTDSTDSVNAGTPVLLTFWAKGLEAETDAVQFGVGIRDGFPGWVSASVVPPTGEWRFYAVPATVRGSGQQGKYALQIIPAMQHQSAEIGGLAVLAFPGDTKDLPNRRDPKTYPGAADPADAAWRARALEGIERYRKSDLAVEVVDAAGRPVPGAEVHVAMQAHAYEWGNGADFGYFGGGLWNVISRYLTDLGREMRSDEYATGRSFNQAGFGIDHKWDKIDKARRNADGDITQSKVWKATESIQNDLGIEKVRGHTLMWGDLQSVPNHIKKEFNARGGRGSDEAVDYLLGEARAHVRQTVGEFKPQLYEWDVINEAFHRMLFEQALGYEGFVEEVATWSKIAEETAPGTTWYVNDNRMFNRGGRMTIAPVWVSDFVVDLREAGAKVDGVGIQGHLGHPLAHPARIAEILDMFDEIDVDVRVTELDISKDVSEMEMVRADMQGLEDVDQDLAAAYLRDFMTVFFGHPSTVGIQMWGFWDTTHWKESALILDSSLNLKETGKVYLDLVFNQWWTDETLRSDDSGRAELRAFHGDYTVTASQGGKTACRQFSLGPDGETLRLVLE